MLDGHEYLTKHGWKGKGTALRSGGISKPLNVTPKRTLSGLGKDRDEAFPFWEHVYDSSINAIKIKVASSDTSSDDEESTRDSNVVNTVLKRTSTGIISNQRPSVGISATFALSPSTSSSVTQPRVNLIAKAKQDLARRQLYSKFYRGPVVSNAPEVKTGVPVVPDILVETSPQPLSSIPATSELNLNSGNSTPSEASVSTKKRKRTDEISGSVDVTGDPESKIAKKAKNLMKEQRRLAKEARRLARHEGSTVTGQDKLLPAAIRKSKTTPTNDLAPDSGDQAPNGSLDVLEPSKSKKKKRSKTDP